MSDMDKCACGRWKLVGAQSCRPCLMRARWTDPQYRAEQEAVLAKNSAAITRVDHDEIVRLGLSGLRYVEIAERCGCTDGWVSHVMREHGHRKALRGKAFVGSVRHG